MLRKFKDINTFFQVFATIISVVIVVANIYAASKLAPVVEDIKGLTDRVQAIEYDRKAVPEYRQKVLILEQKVQQDHESLLEIKSDVKDIRNFLLVK